MKSIPRAEALQISRQILKNAEEERIALTTDAISLLHDRYIGDDPERKASLEEERIKSELQKAFCAGAQWWAVKHTQYCMWRSDVHQTEKEAERRYE